MRRLFLTLALCLLTGAAFAQGGMGPGPGTVHSTGGGCAGYTGPGDIYPGAAFWGGLRGYSCAVAASGTQKAIKVRRTSDSVSCDFLIASSGLLGNTTATCNGSTEGNHSIATFLTATTGFISTLYDQSGNGTDAVQATTGNQPQVNLSNGMTNCTRSMTVTGSKSLASSLTDTSATAGSIAWVHFSSSAFNTGLQNRAPWGQLSGSSSLSTQVFTDNNWYIGWNTSGHDNRVTTAASSGNWPSSSWQDFEFTWSGSGSTVYHTGSSFGTNGTGPTIVNIGSGFTVGLFPGSGGSFDTDILEIGVWKNGAMSSTDTANISANAKSVCGF